MSLLDAMNYFGTIGGLVLSSVAIVYVLGRVGESWARRGCRYRHPASVGRRARIVAQRRAKLDGRGVIK